MELLLNTGHAAVVCLYMATGVKVQTHLTMQNVRCCTACIEWAYGVQAPRGAVRGNI